MGKLCYIDKVSTTDNNSGDDNIMCLDARNSVGDGTHNVKDNTKTSNTKTLEKNCILYCIGANELTEHKNNLIKIITDRLEVFHQNSEKIDTTIFLYPSDKQLWRQVDLELSDKLFNILDSEVKEGVKYIEISPMNADAIAEEYDAYYGSSSPLVPAFVTQKKPVMIANYERQTETGQKGL